MRISDVAKKLGVSPSWLRKLEHQGKIPRARRLLGSNQRRYTPDDLERIREVIYGPLDELQGVTTAEPEPEPAIELTQVSLRHRHGAHTA